MIFVCREEIAPFILPPIIKKGVHLKVASKLVLKQLLDYDGPDDV